ncbi:MAG: DNA-binding protein [candidate division Zixibacteria bacterium]|nr:DNA-binding protein [candidate division Zixibacteria bacterium]
MEYCESEAGYFLRLIRGEEIAQTIADFVGKRGLGGAFFTGLGAIEGVKLGYYDLHQKKYLEKEFSGDVELANMTGNVCYVDGKPFVHVHATILTADFETFSGHLFSGRVAVTVEVNLVATSRRLTRQHDESTGLKLIKFT